MDPNYKIKLREVVESTALYGVYITETDAIDVFKTYPNLYAELEGVGEWETCCSEAFIDAIGHWLGLSAQWPCSDDTDEYANIYFKEFSKAAKLKGLGLSFRFVESKKR